MKIWHLFIFKTTRPECRSPQLHRYNSGWIIDAILITQFLTKNKGKSYIHHNYLNFSSKNIFENLFVSTKSGKKQEENVHNYFRAARSTRLILALVSNKKQGKRLCARERFF